MEIFISLMLLSVLLLALDALALRALQEARTTFFANIAIQQLQNAYAFLQLNVADKSTYLESWHKQNSKLLPLGKGSFEANHLQITWGKSSFVCKQNSMGLFGCLRVKMLAGSH